MPGYLVELVRLVAVLPVVIAGRGTWSPAGPVELAMLQVEGVPVVSVVAVTGRGTWSSWCAWSPCRPW